MPADPTWPQQFEELAARLRGWLGDRALAVHHIGSTSVPGLAAKDVLDVMVSVREDEDFVPVCSALAKHGYRVNPYGHDHPVGATAGPEQWAKGYGSATSGRPVHVHVRVEGRLNHRYALLFRDYLRAHPAMADAYGQAKHRLADLSPEDSGRFADAKDPVCDLVYLAAEEWAGRTGWGTGVSEVD